MCLAVPMKLTEIKDDLGIVELASSKLEVNLQLLENAQVGDYIIVHAGFAIQKLDKKDAEETLSILREIAEIKGK